MAAAHPPATLPRWRPPGPFLILDNRQRAAADPEPVRIILDNRQQLPELSTIRNQNRNRNQQPHGL